MCPLVSLSLDMGLIAWLPPISVLGGSAEQGQEHIPLRRYEFVKHEEDRQPFLAPKYVLS